jgi:hypothetical protein
MKAFVLLALALVLIGGLTACQHADTTPPAAVENEQQANQIAEDSVDSSFVAEDDTVELGEMV